MQFQIRTLILCHVFTSMRQSFIIIFSIVQLESEIEVEFFSMWLNVCGPILIKTTYIYQIKWVTVLIKFFLDFAVKCENHRDYFYTQWNHWFHKRQGEGVSRRDFFGNFHLILLIMIVSSFGLDLPGPSTAAFVIAVLLALTIIVDGW